MALVPEAVWSVPDKILVVLAVQVYPLVNQLIPARSNEVFSVTVPAVPLKL